MLSHIALALLIIFSLAGFAAVFFTTIGTLIILIGCFIYALLTGFSIITVKALIILFLLYAIGEVFENLSVIVGAKKLGSSNQAVVGAIVGGILGAIFGAPFLGVGLIVGTFIGIFLGAFFVELVMRRDIIKGLKAGAGSVMGRAGSIIVKVVIAIIMFVIMYSAIINHIVSQKG